MTPPLTAAAALIAFVLFVPLAHRPPDFASAPPTRAPAPPSIDLLRLDAADDNAAPPAPWRSRAVRGERAPDVQRIDSAGLSFMRIAGTARAGWLFRSVAPPLDAPRGRLRWTWRIPVAPIGTDLRDPATDDSALRVFVSFGPLRSFGRLPRTIFYSLGGPEPDGYAAPGHGLRDVFVVRVGDAAQAGAWRRVNVDPFADYRRAWGGTPPPIAVVGLLQDTDQTRRRAVADILSLHWSPDDALDP
ncbi:MAG: DUF3047 domain-containing protein [Gemmatimonadaceae bacterium]